jgi:chromosome segregation ATPase
MKVTRELFNKFPGQKKRLGFTLPTKSFSFDKDGSQVLSIDALVNLLVKFDHYTQLCQATFDQSKSKYDKLTNKLESYKLKVAEQHTSILELRAESELEKKFSENDAKLARQKTQTLEDELVTFRERPSKAILEILTDIHTSVEEITKIAKTSTANQTPHKTRSLLDPDAKSEISKWAQQYQANMVDAESTISSMEAKILSLSSQTVALDSKIADLHSSHTSNQ